MSNFLLPQRAEMASQEQSIPEKILSLYNLRRELDLSPSSRIGEYIRTIEKAANRTLFTVSLEDSFSVIRSLLEASLIAESFETFRHDDWDSWKTSFAEACGSGQFHPSKRDRPRDIFAEIHAAYLIKRTGLNVKVGEPDLLIEQGESFVGIAVKRPRSHSKIRTRLSEACEQATREGIPSLAFFDLTLSSDEGLRAWSAGSHEDLAELNSYLRSHARRQLEPAQSLYKYRNASVMGGVIGVAHSAAVNRSTGQATIITTFEFVENPRGPTLAVEALRFLQANLTVF